MAKQPRPAGTTPKVTWPQPNPALKDLEPLVGEWNTEIFDAPFLPSPTDKVQAYTSFSWAQDGAFLLMHVRPPVPGDAVWLIGHDDSVNEYDVLYYDARGVSRVYQMSFDGSLWKVWRDAPGFLQRFEGRLSTDGNRIDARWEKSVDGKPWEQDFKLTYTRVR